VKNDPDLIEETLAGNSAAFGQLVCKYQNRLYNVLTRVIGSADEAEDVAQEAFVQAFAKLDTFAGNSSFYTWLYRIALNRSISRRRRKRSHVSLDHLQAVSGAEPEGHGEAPEHRMQLAERAEQLQAALDELSAEHRNIIVLREIDGCCYETIAEILNLPVGTVRSRLHRARLQLRERLRETIQET
jgi:RNA polymerase sigma-70 factor (ECF subfamily)